MTKSIRINFWCLLGTLALTVSVSLAFSNKCQRHPYTNVAKTPGDGGFRIKISAYGSPPKYVPGEVYTVSIEGHRTAYSVQKFTGFMLIAESSSLTGLYGPQSVGTFRLFGDVLTMHSEGCPNAVIQASNILKSEIQVMWTAPPAGSGCIRFKATVIEQRDVWYMDEGELMKELCEDVQKSDVQSDEISDCCACDEAKYEVTFEGLWSRQTHPKDFPKNEWLTHFSDIIGASHSPDYKVWEYGGYASDGLKQVAEWGSTRTLESELKRQSDHIRTIIKARGLWYPNVNGKTFAVFRVDNRHHLMSLVSMLGPTPDWIVGESSLELCLKNCSWIGQKEIELFPWDAGTDSGVTYMSANAPTIPRQKIRRITNTYPNDPKNPFYEPTRAMKPLAKLTITRQRVYEKSCSDTRLLGPDKPHVNEPLSYDRPECATTEWSEFSSCSASCGKGLRMRTRRYLIPMKADMFRCDVQLQETEMCKAPVDICDGGSADDVFGGSSYNPLGFGGGNNPVGHNLGHGLGQGSGQGQQSICMTTEWSSWSPCSVTCGEGFSIRSRRYLDRMGRKKCSESLVDKRTCQGEVSECAEEEEEIDPACAVTQWTRWSPCSVTCGQGVRVRTRYFLVPTANQEKCGVNSMDKMICEGERKDCNIDESEAKEVCLQDMEIGPCRGYFPRWHFNSQRGMCVQFIYGGCRGNRNNFKTYDECTKMCEFARDELYKPDYANTSSLIPERSSYHGNNDDDRHSYHANHDADRSSYHANQDQGPFGSYSSYHESGLVPASQLGPKSDCVMTEWSDWSECSVACGAGWIETRRSVKMEPQFGGKPCPKKLVRRKKCKMPRCSTGAKSDSKPYHHDLESLSFIFDPSQEYSSPILPPSSELNILVPSSSNQVSPSDSQEVIMKEMTLEGSNEKIDCVMGDWGPWSPCTQSCGSEALQQRARSIVVKQRNNGTPCGPRLERRYCTLPPCLYNSHGYY